MRNIQKHKFRIKEMQPLLWCSEAGSTEQMNRTRNILNATIKGIGQHGTEQEMN